MSEKIPCPVDGCDLEFESMAAATVHMKDVHKDEFSAPMPRQPPEPPEGQLQRTPEEQKELEEALAMIPPGMMKLLDARMDARIDAALVRYLPQVKEAVTGAMKQVIGTKPHGTVDPITGLPDGGVIPGSPVTPMGAQIMQWIMRGGGGGGTGAEAFLKQAAEYKAVFDVFQSPPSLAERMMTSAQMRMLRAVNKEFVSEKSLAALDKELGLTE